MRVRKVNRYYCDFCKKAGGSGGHIRKHEDHCTMNPQRGCGVCGILKAEQKPMADLLACLPDPLPYVEEDEFDAVSYSAELTVAVNAALPALRDLAGSCPACILAAIRQKGIPVPMVTSFNWTSEMDAIWAEVNRRAAEECRH